MTLEGPDGNQFRVYNEIKSHQNDKILERLGITIPRAAQKGSNGRTQLMGDLVEFILNGHKTNRWIYPKAAQSFQYKGASGERAIIKAMLDVVSAERAFFMKKLNIQNPSEWDNMFEGLKDKMFGNPFVELLDI